MTDTTNLALPYLEAAQAQKHVTHNEALTTLDAIVVRPLFGRFGWLNRDMSFSVAETQPTHFRLLPEVPAV